MGFEVLIYPVPYFGAMDMLPRADQVLVEWM